MLKDEIGFGVSHRGMAGEVVEHEIAEFVGVARRDMEEVILRASHVEEANDARQVRRKRTEIIDIGAGMTYESDRNECLQRNANASEVNLGTEAVNYPGGLQSLETL